MSNDSSTSAALDNIIYAVAGEGGERLSSVRSALDNIISEIELTEVSASLLSDDWGVSDISSDEEGSVIEGSLDKCCNRCDHIEAVILTRGFGWEDSLELRDMGNGEELICRSCMVGGEREEELRRGFYCIDCGYSEILYHRQHVVSTPHRAMANGWTTTFYQEGEERPEYQNETTRCPGCRERVERYDIELASDDHEWYDGEFELEESVIDKDDEISQRVKKTVHDLGEIVFDIKDKITEGEYLGLMNGLQSITNEMNN